MSSTYLSLHYHIVFATKGRLPLIKNNWSPRLHGYIGGTICGLEGVPQGIGGIENHIHLLVGLKSTHCISDLMRELKKSSSLFVRDEIGEKDFAWQEGYAAFTVSSTSREAVKKYIENQLEHHRVKSFREELELMLKKAGIEYDPKYLD